MISTRYETMKVWTKEEIARNVASNDDWVVAGLLAIYEQQTRDEKALRETKHVNDVGFNCADARKMSSFAEQAKAWKEHRGRSAKFPCALSDKQIFVARKRLKKYVGQLTDIANKNEAKKAETELETR